MKSKCGAASSFPPPPGEASLTPATTPPDSGPSSPPSSHRMSTTVEPLAQTLLARAHSPSTAAEIYSSSIKHRPLLLHRTTPKDAGDTSVTPSDARAARRRARQHKSLLAHRAAKSLSHSGRDSQAPRDRPLSAKRKRQLGLLEIPPDQRQYALYADLHRLWCGYMLDVLGLDGEGRRKAGPSGHAPLVTPDGSGPVLASADYHGALVRVVRSGCVSRVGIEGIVVRDTKFTFEIVTRRNALKVVPKEGTVFRIEVLLHRGQGMGEGEGKGEPETDGQESAGDKTESDQTATVNADVLVKGLEAGKARSHNTIESSENTPDRKVVFEIYGDRFRTAAADRANKKWKMHYPAGL